MHVQYATLRYIDGPRLKALLARLSPDQPCDARVRRSSLLSPRVPPHSTITPGLIFTVIFSDIKAPSGVSPSNTYETVDDMLTCHAD
jgi:hypothetical protein